MNAQFGDSAVAVLGYHKIGKPPTGLAPTIWYIPEDTFRKHLLYLRTRDWEVITVDRLLTGLSQPGTLPRRAALLTFDDGYKSMLGVASPCLVEFGYPSVNFVPTGYVGGYNDWDEGREPREPICAWEDLLELDRRGCSVQSHGVWHKGFGSLTAQEQDQELRGSKTAIETKLEKAVQVFAYPYGDARGDRSALTDVLKRNGYRAAFLYSVPGSPIRLPVDNCYFLPRLGILPQSDLPTLLGS